MYFKVFGSGFVSLYAASECLTVFSCLNKKPLQTFERWVHEMEKQLH